MPFSHHWLQRLRGSVDSVSASRFRADGSNHSVGSYFFIFIEKFTEYFLLFIFSLSFLYVFFLSSQENACISEFDLLLSTYSKWLYNDQFRSYFSIYIHVYSSFPYNSFSKFDHIGSYKVYATCIPTDIESCLLRRPYSHISCKPNVYLPPCITPIPIPFESLCTHVF